MINKLKIKKLNPEAKIPHFSLNGDAGLDLYSAEDLSLNSGERKICKTGIAMSIPCGFVGLIWDKSGISSKNGIKTMGGVVDSGYRGEICVILVNLSAEKYEIKKGEKIAQMLIQKFENPEILEVENLDETERGENGFGSTGLC